MQPEEWEKSRREIHVCRFVLFALLDDRHIDLPCRFRPSASSLPPAPVDRLPTFVSIAFHTQKEVERRRRLLINASISSLSSAVPPSFSYTPPPSQDTGDPGGGKTEALQRALAYVMWLKEENRRLREKAGEPAEDEEGNGVEGGEA